MGWSEEYQKRRHQMLAYYPDVSPVGNLTDALTGALAAVGSTLTAIWSIPPEEPTWSPFSDHPEAPGTTVPEETWVRGFCLVRIGWFQHALGEFGITFEKRGMIVATDLATTATIIHRVLEHHQEPSAVAQEFDVVFHPAPEFTPEMKAEAELVAAKLRKMLGPEEPEAEGT